MNRSVNNVRLSDIADELGITVNTVSKALRGKGGVSDQLRQRIQQVSDRMGYVPNRVATSLRYGQSKMIAVIFDNLINPYFMIMTDMLFSKLRALDYDVLIIAGVFNEIKTADLNCILSRKVDGIITFINPSKEVVDILDRNRIPLVLLGRQNAELKVASVSTNDFMGGYSVGQYLLKKNAKNIGYLGIPREVGGAQRRLDGLVKCLEDHGVPYDRDNFQFKTLRDMMPQANKLIENGTDAVFCFNDIMALEFYSIVRKRKLRVPEDIMIVGYDDIQNEFPSAISLTTVSSDKERIVQATIELLLGKIKGTSDPAEYVHRDFEVFVRIGETT